MIFDNLLLLGITSGFIQFLGYVVYFLNVVKEHSKPNPASWLIWSYGNAMVCLSYVFVNQDLSIATEILPVICSITCIVMTAMFFFLGKFRPLEKFEKIIISIDVLITILWVLSEFFGLVILPFNLIHLLLLVSAIISFIPLYGEVIRDRMAEKPAPWIIWSIAYLTLTLVVLLEGGDFWAILFPITYLLLHFMVIFFTSVFFRKLI